MKQLLVIAAALLAVSSVQAWGNYTGAQSNAPRSSFSHTPNFAQSSASDQQLTNDIRSRLSSGAFAQEFKQVTVSVKNGAVTLAGTVPSQAVKEKLEQQVRSTNGVLSLNSQIAISERAPAEMKPTTQHKGDFFQTPSGKTMER